MDKGIRPKRLEDIAHVAELYYKHHLDQKEIAAQIHASRSTVSRMLKEAIEHQVVEVVIRHPFPRDSQLESELKETLNISEAWVLARDSTQTEDDQAAFGALGARCVESHLPSDSSLAICWGRATRLVVENLRSRPGVRPHTIQMIGSMGTSDSIIDGVELTRLAAKRLGGTYQLLNAPLVVDDAKFAQGLLKQSAIRTVLRAATDATCALVGLGTLDPASSALHSAGYMSRQELLEAGNLGAVGDVSGHLITGRGTPIRSTFSSRVIGLPLNHMKKIKTVIGAAYGVAKVDIILAAILGQHIDVLVTDREAARGVLKMARVTKTAAKTAAAEDKSPISKSA